MHALRPTDAQPGWDRARLEARLKELLSDLRAERWLYDEALAMGWHEEARDSTLSRTEQAWRRAHQAAATGDLPALMAALQELPTEGYPERARLLVPYLALIRADRHRWREVLTTLTAEGVESGREVHASLSAAPADALAATTLLLDPAQRSSWSALGATLRTGEVDPPPSVGGTPAWTAAALLGPTGSGGDLDGHVRELEGLELALLDDIVDRGRLTARAAPSPTTSGRYIAARLDPSNLSDATLRELGHTPELARRMFLRGDRDGLESLPTSPEVEHYRALLQFPERAGADDPRLRSEVASLLRTAQEALGALKDGVGALPASVVEDPSQWTLFAAHAEAGHVVDGSHTSTPEALGSWLGLRRLLGLVYQGSFSEALDHGKALLGRLPDEQSRDEVLNLVAFALLQLGRPEEALDKLDFALSGAFTENLLVNVSIVASQVTPETGVRHLVRLAEHAPPELRRASLDRAITVWKGSGQPFPHALVPLLRDAVGRGGLAVEDFFRLAQVMVDEVPDALVELRSPGGALDGPFQLMVAEAKLRTAPQFGLSDLAREYLRVYRSTGRSEWFNDRFGAWVESVRSSVYVDFGDAQGSAGFIDVVLADAPELFSDEERWELAPQAGAHLSAARHAVDLALDEWQWNRFFFGPGDDLLAKRSERPTSLVDILATNFTRCLGVAASNTLAVSRAEVVARYNPLVEREQWDQQNQYAIASQRRQIIDAALSGPVRVLVKAVEQMRRLGSTDDGLQRLTRLLAEDVDGWRDEMHRLRGR